MRRATRGGALVALSLAFVSALALGLARDSTAQTGSTLVVTDNIWRCTQPLSSYASGGLPLRVEIAISPGVVINPANGAGVVQLGQGCVGPGQDGTLDLEIIVPGDGLTYGAGHDAVRFMNATPGVSNMDIRIEADCGPRVGGNHQDGLQILGGTNVTVWDSAIGGDYDAGKPTCQGAGGALFYSLPSNDVDVVGGKFIGCNHALNAHPGTGTNANVSGASFRSGYTPGDAVCEGYFVSQPCDLEPGWGGQTENLTCDRYPFDDVQPPPPPPPPPPAPECSNALDDDADGAVDYPSDPGCEAAGDTSEAPDPPPPPPEAQCADGADNDGDGLVDLNDPGCESATDDDETNAPPDPPAYNPACAPTCDEQIATLDAEVARLNGIIDAALTALGRR